MHIKNAKVYNSYKKSFIRADVAVEDGKFEEILYTGSSRGEAENIVVPGFVDIHSHGANGIDMMNSNCGELVKMSGYYAKNGVTTLFLSTSSAPFGLIMKMIEETKKAKSEAKINFAGIHLEGPYINKNRAGAHMPQFIKEPDLNELGEIMEATLGCGLKLHITVAPELSGAFEFIAAAVKKGATISMGHTEADGETIKKAIGLGAKSFTHLFNAMSPIHHRNAGAAGAALAGDAYVELICDGIHLCPEVVRLVQKAKGCQKIILVSDSMSAAGLPEGQYSLGETKGVFVEGGRAFLKNADGTETIAGSTSNLYRELVNFMDFTGRSLEESLLTVTKNPAECVGIYDKKGSIETGKDADFVIMDKEGAIREVYVNGERAS
ncbi:MAG: N-acetylglucosamine-6-phosphate deacetylase [Oscillospiraceae bacterium]|nr:N-acetylglucosamine-6-phosphate deacetylase [Oscillospiraceae bacterium]